MRKILQRLTISLLVLCLFTTGIGAAAADTATFSDVPVTYWAYDSIEQLYAAGIIGGYGDGIFAPVNTLTAAHFAKMLVLTACPEAVTSASAENVWYAPYTQACLTQGISDGVGLTDWNQPVTRYDMAIFLINCIEKIYGYEPVSASIERITDYAQIPENDRYAVVQAYSRGLLGGFSDGSFRGSDYMTRAQAAVVVCRMLDYDGSVIKTTSSGTAQSAKLTEGFLKTSQLDRFGYLLYTPENPQVNLPLVVYLHGGSGKGSDPSVLTENDGFPKYLQDGDLGSINAYILIPQLPSEQRGWTDVAASLDELIDTICKDQQINTDKVSLTGHSMGGTGVWGLAVLEPARFSCIAPLSGSVRVTPANVQALSNLPVWAFVGSADTIVLPGASEQMTAHLKSRGANAQLTELDGATHFDVPQLVYLNRQTALMDWLVSNSR